MYNCAKCFQRGCTKQDMTKTLPECPSKDTAVQEQAKELYRDPENYRIAYCAALTEAGGYCKDTRMIEIIKFCTAPATKRSAWLLHRPVQGGAEVVKILEYNGFEVVSIICKNGAITRIFWASPTLSGARKLQNRVDVQPHRAGAAAQRTEDRV